MSLTTIRGNLNAERIRLGVAYELWVWLPLTGILIFSLAYLAVAYCKKHEILCYKQNQDRPNNVLKHATVAM